METYRISSKRTELIKLVIYFKKEFKIKRAAVPWLVSFALPLKGHDILKY